MGFLGDLLLIAAGLFGLLCLIGAPGWTTWTVVTLGGGYAGHESGGILGTLAGLVGGAIAGVVVVGLLWGLREGLRAAWKQLVRLNAWIDRMDSERR